MTKYRTTIEMLANDGTQTTIRLIAHKESVPECIADNGKFYVLTLSDVLASKYNYREIIPIHISEL